MFANKKLNFLSDIDIFVGGSPSKDVPDCGTKFMEKMRTHKKQINASIEMLREYFEDYPFYGNIEINGESYYTVDEDDDDYDGVDFIARYNYNFEIELFKDPKYTVYAVYSKSENNEIKRIDDKYQDLKAAKTACENDRNCSAYFVVQYDKVVSMYLIRYETPYPDGKEIKRIREFNLE